MATRIMILGFGGTIAMVPGPNGLTPAKGIDEILQMVPIPPELAEVSFEEIENADSVNINPSHWTRLAYKIQELHGQYDAIIVTHGTDTMAYTASAVALAVGSGLQIPIIFTGSQLALVEFGSDARFNLENSVKAAVKASEESIAEVMIVFGDKVLRASRAIKVSEAKFPAFDSPAFEPLASITAVGVDFRSIARKASSEEELQLRPHFQRGILAIDLVPGLEPSMLAHTLRSGQCKGLLLKSLGAGNVPDQGEYSLLPVIREAVSELKIPVLIATKFVGGKTEMDLYATGRLARQAGAIPTGDMTDVMAQVKLMWALHHSSLEELIERIQTDHVGEITI